MKCAASTASSTTSAANRRRRLSGSDELVETIPQNFFADLKQDSQETIEELLRSPHVRIERIVSSGQASPEGFWFDQDQDEWVIVLRGAARLGFADGRVIEMREGSFINIPAHERHRVEWTDPEQITVWLAIHHH